MIDLAMGFNVAAAHFGVAVDAAVGKAAGLDPAGGGHPPADILGGFGVGFIFYLKTTLTSCSP